MNDMPPVLPQSLINLIGEYGQAHRERVWDGERLHRWELLIAGIKDYARSHAAALEADLTHLRHDIGEYVRIANTEATRCTELEAELVQVNKIARDAVAGYEAALLEMEALEAALEEAVEDAAKAIYYEWRCSDHQYVPWVEGGNSHKQDDARKIARTALKGDTP